MAIAGVATSGAGLAIGLVIAVAIPSLYRPTIGASEAGTISDVRKVIAAQRAYSAPNAGFYEGRLGCLAKPADCIPGYSAAAAPFLDARLASLEPKSGYTRVLRAGPGIDAVALEPQRRRASPTSVTAFAYVAVPVRPGETGSRGFCGDSNGVVCATPQGSAPQLTAEGTCDRSGCVELR